MVGVRESRKETNTENSETSAMKNSERHVRSLNYGKHLRSKMAGRELHNPKGFSSIAG